LIIQGKYEFHPESWDNISEQAKDLIKCLLQVDYKERYSPFQALMHPWVANVIYSLIKMSTFSMERYQINRSVELLKIYGHI